MKSFPKTVRVKDESRLQWCRTLPCILFGLKWHDGGSEGFHICSNRPIDAHHVTPKGVGGSDFTTLPLCRFAHQKYHRIGRQRFEALYQVDLDALLVEHNSRYRKEVKPKRKTRTPSVKLFAKCSCGGMHPVRGGRFYCTRARTYVEVA